MVAGKLTDSNSFSYLRVGAKGLLLRKDARAAAAGRPTGRRRRLLGVPPGPVALRGLHSERHPRSQHENGRWHWPKLTRAEALGTLLQNLSNKEIATKPHISERRVKFHVSGLLAEFSVRRRADLILFCFQQRVWVA